MNNHKAAFVFKITNSLNIPLIKLPLINEISEPKKEKSLQFIDRIGDKENYIPHKLKKIKIDDEKKIEVDGNMKTLPNCKNTLKSLFQNPKTSVAPNAIIH